MNNQIIEGFQINAKQYMKTLDINQSILFEFYDEDQNGTLNEQEFLNLILSFNNQYQSLKEEIKIIYHQTKQNQNEISIKDVQNLLTMDQVEEQKENKETSEERNLKHQNDDTNQNIEIDQNIGQQQITQKNEDQEKKFLPTLQDESLQNNQDKKSLTMLQQIGSKIGKTFNILFCVSDRKDTPSDHPKENALQQEEQKQGDKIRQYKVASTDDPQEQLVFSSEYFNLVESVSNDFQDTEFPPNQNSLGGFKEHKYQWRNLRQQYGKDYTLFPVKNQHDKFEALPRQGKMGNCYFIAPLAGIYHLHPQAIKALFIDHREDITCMKLNIDGQWYSVWVDHYFPFNSNKNIPCFGKKLEGAVWAMLLEKAWAKVFGSYKNTVAGYNTTVLRALTGAPITSMSSDNPNFSKVIDYWASMKYPMTCNTKGKKTLEKINNDDGDSKGSQGLMGNHAYTVFKVIEKIACDGQPRQFLYLRNPWGFKKWTGDQEKLIEGQIKQTVKQIKKNNQGVFYIDLNNFTKYFKNIEVCFYYPHFQYESYRINSDLVAFLTINVKQTGLYFFTSLQKNRRFFRSQPEIKYSFSPSILGIIDENQVIIQRNSYRAERNNLISVELQQGKSYLVYTQVSFHSNIPHKEYIISSYGEDQVNFQLIGYNILYIPELKYKCQVRKNKMDEYFQSKEEKINQNQNNNL